MEIIEFLIDMKNFFDNADTIKKELEEHIAEVELARNDLLHELELGNLNGAETMKLAKTLKQILQERRKYKDELQKVLVIKNFTDKYNNKLIVGDILQTIKGLKTIEHNQENRKYTPRIVENLKCAEVDNDKNK